MMEKKIPDCWEELGATVIQSDTGDCSLMSVVLPDDITVSQIEQPGGMIAGRGD